MTHHTCDRCGQSVTLPTHVRKLPTPVEPLTKNWANRFGFDALTAAGPDPVFRTHVTITISAPGVDDDLELCAHCFAELTRLALDAPDPDPVGVETTLKGGEA